MTLYIECDDYSASAPYHSDRWATSDRGWIFAVRPNMDRTTGDHGHAYVTLGTYLDYSANNGAIHAVCYVTRESTNFMSVREAKAWILDRARGRIAEYFACEASTRGAYQHEADAIRKLAVDETVQLGLGGAT